jgi:hypothetical protein
LAVPDPGSTLLAFGVGFGAEATPVPLTLDGIDFDVTLAVAGAMTHMGAWPVNRKRWPRSTPGRCG